VVVGPRGGGARCGIRMMRGVQSGIGRGAASAGARV
jgi:hypothetical protein